MNDNTINPSPPATTGADNSQSPAKPEGEKDAPPWWVLGAFLVATVMFVALFGWSVSSASLLFIELLLAAAALGVGALLGFLFGMPRSPGMSMTTRQDAEDPTRDTVSYQPSNNLEQVSDWLTKILIGVGLVEIKQLAGLLRNIGSAVAYSIKDAPPGTAVVTEGVIVTFIVFGLLASFLWTRIYYGPLQTLADNDVINRLRETLADYKRKLQKVESKKETAVMVAKQLATGEIAAPSVPRSEATTAPVNTPSPDVDAWPKDILDKIERFRRSPPDWYSDPGAAIFDNPPRQNNGRKLSAEIVMDLSDALVIKLKVESPSGEKIRGTVMFLLHPTFADPIIYVRPEGNIAETTISSGGWFTVVAILNEGKTILAYNLRDLANGPDWFKNG